MKVVRKIAVFNQPPGSLTNDQPGVPAAGIDVAERHIRDSFRQNGNPLVIFGRDAGIRLCTNQPGPLPVNGDSAFANDQGSIGAGGVQPDVGCDFHGGLLGQGDRCQQQQAGEESEHGGWTGMLVSWPDRSRAKARDLRSDFRVRTGLFGRFRRWCGESLLEHCGPAHDGQLKAGVIQVHGENRAGIRPQCKIAIR